MIHSRNKNMLFIVCFVGLLLGLLFGIYILSKNQNINSVNSFDDCVKAGGVILETYPEQCRINSKSFVNDIQNEVSYPENFYGSSSKAACDLDSDCVYTGCNAEICQGISEESRGSICVKPEQLTALELNFKCGCFQQKCQWYK